MRKDKKSSQKVKFKITPDFFIFTAFVLLIGKFEIFFVYVSTVLFHESVHLFVAKKLRYKCDSLTLSAFGTVLYGDFEQAVGKQQVLIALSAPLANLFFACIFCTVWYLFPSTYVFTLSFALANVSLAAINLLPCYPLDGGKILISLLCKKYSYRQSLRIAKNCGICISLLLFTVFVISIFSKHNLFSLGLFSILLLTSSFATVKENPFHKMPFMKLSQSKLNRGIEKKVLVFSENATIGDAVRRFESNTIYDIEILDEVGIVQFKANYDLLCDVIMRFQYNDNLLSCIKKAVDKID